MRKIKFRQPITFLNGKFLKFHYWGFISAGAFASPETTKAGGFIEGASQKSQQFVGLLDKNGKEIYEGDILEIKPNSDDILTVEVIFHKGCFCYKTKEGGIFAFYSSDDWMCIPENKKVIGNIYENPELLKNG